MSVDWHAKAMRALPILVDRAQKGDTIAYSELGDMIDVHHRNVRHVLQVIRDDICKGGDRAPMINVLVVRKGSKCPGGEVLGPHGEHLSESARDRAVARQKQRVFEYDAWPELLAEYSLNPINQTS
jgi:hypothetical protein